MRRQLLSVLLLVSGLAACARPAMYDGPEAGANTPPTASGGCDATNTPSPSYPSAPPTTDSSFYARQDRLDDMAQKVTRVGARYPQVYAGVELADDHSKIIVFRVPSARFDSAVRAALPGDPVSIVDATHSARELNTVLDRVLHDEDYWTRRGTPIFSLSPLVDGSCVQVTTTDPVKAKALFRLRYEAAPIQVIHGEPAVPVEGARRTTPAPSEQGQVVAGKAA